MLKPKLRESKLLAVLLVTAANACASGARMPKAPDIKECMIDLERQRSICWTIVSEEGPVFLPLSEMDKFSCKSPDDKALYDDWIKDLKRKWDAIQKALEAQRNSRK